MKQSLSQKELNGIGFRNLALWNQDVVGKLAWAIAKKQDNLSVKWVHVIYIKDKNWLWSIFAEPRRLIQLDSTPQRASLAIFFLIGGTYKHICEAQVKVSWHTYVCNIVSVPKHGFILWLTLHDRVKIRDWLSKYMGYDSIQSPVCDQVPESITHYLFF